MEPAKLVVACLGALGVLIGCGGTTDHNGAHADSGGSTNSSGGSTNSSGGSSATSGSTAEAATNTGGVAPVMTLDSFETNEVYVSVGLWMGFPGNKLPIGAPATAHNGSALHLVGTTNDDGLDVFFHTGIPVERIWRGVRFWTQSDEPNSSLTVAVAGPEPSYFKDRAQGIAWPEQLVVPTKSWQEVVVDFKDLGVDAEHLSPHSEQFGAFHFIIEPNTKYDLWIDDFVGQSR